MIANILMTGVGGQGVVLASDALAEIAVKCGFDVKKSDSLGMSQRGGSVVSHLRISDKVYSPVIKRGEADFLLAFERLEGARWANFLRKGGTAIVNDHAIPPLSAVGGASAYPSTAEALGMINKYADNAYIIPGTELARELGNPQVLNVLLIGYLSTFLPIEEQCFIDDLSQRVPPRLLELNLKAFARGREEAKSSKPARDDSGG